MNIYLPRKTLPIIQFLAFHYFFIRSQFFEGNFLRSPRRTYQPFPPSSLHPQAGLLSPFIVKLQADRMSGHHEAPATGLAIFVTPNTCNSCQVRFGSTARLKAHLTEQLQCPEALREGRMAEIHDLSGLEASSASRLPDRLIPIIIKADPSPKLPTKPTEQLKNIFAIVSSGNTTKPAAQDWDHDQLLHACTLLVDDIFLQHELEQQDHPECHSHAVETLVSTDLLKNLNWSEWGLASAIEERMEWINAHSNNGLYQFALPGAQTIALAVALELRQLKPDRNTLVFQRIADHSILAKLTTSVVAYSVGIRNLFIVSDFPRHPDSSKESADQDVSMTGSEEHEPTDLAGRPEPKNDWNDACEADRADLQDAAVPFSPDECAIVPFVSPSNPYGDLLARVAAIPRDEVFPDGSIACTNPITVTREQVTSEVSDFLDAIEGTGLGQKDPVLLFFKHFSGPKNWKLKLLSQHNKDKICCWLMTKNQATLSGQVEVFADKDLTTMLCASPVTITLPPRYDWNALSDVAEDLRTLATSLINSPELSTFLHHEANIIEVSNRHFQDGCMKLEAKAEALRQTIRELKSSNDQFRGPYAPSKRRRMDDENTST
ncbi:hypothetical protein S7711_10503 [Stachybotrys chartarum IBT 7711]|uniref:Uncharacterized protein n=1 Tax=Stachybotrys chartarum (strain CBS 109288 / IBT 7711) TaxID=1280523 RepID=A0A084AVB9_STACB|nr:hypothetical protein S7711_10503 [Stachybotrys chartarum IBT 7711]